MFHNINKSGLLSVKETLTDSNFDVDSTRYIVDALEICLTISIFCKLMVQHRVLICLVPMLTLPWPSMTLLPIISILSLVFGKDLEMIFLYMGIWYCFSLFLFRLFEYYG